MTAPRSGPKNPSTAPRALLALAAAAFGLALLGNQPTGRAETPENGCETAAPTAVQVTVERVRNSKGLITAVLYDDNPDTFLKKGARVDRIRVEAREGETVLCLLAPAAGRYTVALYHDENGNKEFDQDFIGVPTEGYGFSNNPGFTFGKPDQEKTLFTIDDAPISLRISLRYLQG